jgi:predicted transcriptional regulator
MAHKKSIYPATVAVQVPSSWPEALDKLAASKSRTRSEVTREALAHMLKANGLFKPEAPEKTLVAA